MEKVAHVSAETLLGGAGIQVVPAGTSVFGLSPPTSANFPRDGTIRPRTAKIDNLGPEKKTRLTRSLLALLHGADSKQRAVIRKF